MIEATNLSKRYGDIAAVDGVSFSVERGEVVGFLGPNGAGKTTTMRMLTGFLPPTDGTARICGHDIFEEPLEARRAIGYLPETPPLYPEMTVSSYVDYVARIKDVPRRERRAQGGARARALRSRRRVAARDRNALEGLSPARRARAGDRARAAGADPRRADDRPRPDPDRRDPRADRRARGRRRRRAAHGDPLHAHPARGRGDLPPRGDDQRGPQDGRRTARRAHERRPRARGAVRARHRAGRRGPGRRSRSREARPDRRLARAALAVRVAGRLRRALAVRGARGPVLHAARRWASTRELERFEAFGRPDADAQPLRPPRSGSSTSRWA